MDVSFHIRSDKLLKKCKDIWNKVSNTIKKKHDSKPIYNKEFLKNKIKSYGDEATGFYDK